MKHIAHPIVGDTTYGKSLHNRLFKDRLGCDRLLLSAVEMSFVHPVDGRRLRLVAPLDKGFYAVLQHLSWQHAIALEWT